MLCLVAEQYPTLCYPWSIAHQFPLSMGFSRQKYQSVLPCPPPGDLPNPGIKSRFPTLQANSFHHLSHQGRPNQCIYVYVLVAQSCPTLCNPVNYSLPGPSVHGILQARSPWSFPDGKVVKNPPENAGHTTDAGQIPGSGRFPGAGNGCILAWRIPWVEEPCGLQSMGSQGVGHD